jgi:hypothetical protein
LKACVDWGVPPTDVISVVARSRCKQWVVFAVFRALCGNSICRCYFLLLPFRCTFQAPVDDKQSKEEHNIKSLWCNLIFFMSFCVKLSFFCTINCLSWYEPYMRHLWVSFSKKVYNIGGHCYRLLGFALLVL